MLTQQITNYEEAYRVALVASELIENVCRYSTGGMASIDLEQGKNKSDIELRIRNLTKKENIEEFKKVFSIINSGSALDAYKAMMLRVVNSDDNSLSQLGLARIRYEGRSELDYEVESDIKPLMKGNISIDRNNKPLVLCIKSKMSIELKDNGEAHGV